MEELSTIGLDLAKNVFYIHGADKYGKTLFKEKLSRDQVLPYFANLKPCLVGMEAGGGTHYWAREILKLGHEAKIMAPQFVKPYLKSNKTDENDAEAICEAVTRPNMRFVSVKQTEQQDIQSIHRIRSRIVRNRSSLACEIRGLLGEYGIVFPVGIREITKRLPDIISDQENQLNPYTRVLIQNLLTEFLEMSYHLRKYNAYIQDVLREDERAKRLFAIPGVGPLAATAIIASCSDPSLFKNGREFAAYLGLVPKQSSSGGKARLLGISKRGDKYIRTALIHGARAVIARNEELHKHSYNRQKWIKDLRERKGFCKTAVALANKNARICWALLSKGEEYKLAV